MGRTAVEIDPQPDGPPWASWLLVGPTGSGKTPLGHLFEEKGLGSRRCRHFDFGAELRAVAAGPEGTADLAAAQIQVIRESLSSGALLEDRDFPIALGVLRAFVRRAGFGGDDRLVLNGLPRHVGQARLMEDAVRMIAVASLEAAPEVVRERIRLNTAGDRLERPDDDLRAIRKRLVIFRMRTLPLVDYYENREVPVFRLSVGTRTTAGEMYERIVAAAAGRGIL
jgi:adenylate kinase